MCTAMTWPVGDFYMGRTLDYEKSYGETVTVTPRGKAFSFRHGGGMEKHLAFVGMAHVAEGYPLYYDGVNEQGLGMVGLHFPGNAHYPPPGPGKRNLAQFELLPYLLGQCADLAQARTMLAQVQLVDTPFHPSLPPSPLHWLIADASGALVAEPTSEGLRVYDNPVGVLTNNPPFPQQLLRLCDYMQLSPAPPVNRLVPDVPLTPYSRGMGGMGLPGDLSSPSRFVRAVFARAHAVPGRTEEEMVGQFFHMMGMVAQVRGCCVLENGAQEHTLYTGCWNAARGIYYTVSYLDRRIHAADLHRAPLDGSALVSFPLSQEEVFVWQN